MKPAELIDDARHKTGLDDFGGDGFREGLEVLCRALAEEAQLNEMGQQVARHQLLRLLATRLEVHDCLRRHPEIEAQVLRAPIFVLGLPRTGTTALSALLARDPDTRSPPQRGLRSPRTRWARSLRAYADRKNGRRLGSIGGSGCVLAQGPSMTVERNPQRGRRPWLRPCFSEPAAA